MNHRKEQGQALSEYIVLYPIAVGILVMATLIGAGLLRIFTYTVEAIDPPQICEIDEQQGQAYADFTQVEDHHSIALVSVVYDANTDRTTVVYTVTSGPKPSISHWILGLPQHVAANLISVSDSQVSGWSAAHPPTGVGGIKFDNGYEVNDNGGGNGGPGGPPPGRGPSKLPFLDLQTADPDMVATASRDIAMMFSGQYDFSPTNAVIKAGVKEYHTVILAPSAPATPEGPVPRCADEDEG